MTTYQELVQQNKAALAFDLDFGDRSVELEVFEQTREQRAQALEDFLTLFQEEH